MVQGLAFLSKKSWHTKNIANQERVWIEEQKKAAEESKTQELAKQIQQERENDELDRIAGKKTKRLDRGIDWMYQGVTSEAAQEAAKKEAEEYLMGKEFAGASTQPRGDLAQAEDDMEGVNAVLSRVAQPDPQYPSNERKSSIITGPSISDRNEAFRMRLEDPMFLVSQKRRELEMKVEKKKALYEKFVGSNDDGEDSHKRRRRERKERKKDRKHRMESRRRKDRSRSRSASDEDYHHRSHRRRRIKSTDDYEKRTRYDDDSDHNYPRRQGDRFSRHNASSPVTRPDDRSRRYCDKDPPSGENKRRESALSTERKAPPSGEHKSRGSILSTDDRDQDCSTNFGLQGASKSLDLKDLGPSTDLVSKRRKEQDAERDRTKPAPRRRMTPEEREQALRDMQANANKHNASRLAKGSTEEDEGERKSAAFLHRMAEQTHGIHGDHISMADRIARNRHTNQKSSDSFL